MATRTAKDRPIDRTIADRNGRLTEPWDRHLELVSDTLKQLEQEVDAFAPLAGGATLADVITRVNALTAALQRALN